MAAIYTISEKSRWKVGAILSPAKLEASGITCSCKIEEKEIVDFLHSNFPEGLSSHGVEKILHPLRNRDQVSLEVVFELVRQLKFPHRISRFNSMFSFESLEYCEELVKTTGFENHSIYKIECTDYFRADMNLIRFGQSPIEEVLLAEKYWRGLQSDDPVFQCLAKFPVQITEEIGRPVSMAP